MPVETVDSPEAMEIILELDKKSKEHIRKMEEHFLGKIGQLESENSAKDCIIEQRTQLIILSERTAQR